jgi:hypothetical protein
MAEQVTFRSQVEWAKERLNKMDADAVKRAF